MVQPKTPPLSIRPGAERLARIDAYASEHKLSRHLAILLMLDEGYRSLTSPVTTPTTELPNSGAVRALTGAGPKDRVFSVGGAMVVEIAEPLRMPRAPIGSRLDKKAKR